MMIFQSLYLEHVQLENAGIVVWKAETLTLRVLSYLIGFNQSCGLAISQTELHFLDVVCIVEAVKSYE